MDLIEAFTAGRPKGFLARYPVELLYEARPDLTMQGLAERLAERCPQVAVSADSSSGRLRCDLREEREGAVPWWSLEIAARRIDPEAFFQVVEQSWSWREAAELLPRCRQAVRIEDHDVLDLDPRRRIELLQRIVAATMELSPPLAIHWLPTQQLIEPREALATWLDDDFTSPLPGALNVRFYRIEGASESDDPEFLMDTVGLCAVGLNDLQCHFRGLHPEEVGPTLYNLALHFWDRERIPKSGESVQGPRPDDRWRCQAEVSIAPPERDVIDLDPGFPFTGGESVG